LRQLAHSRRPDHGNTILLTFGIVIIATFGTMRGTFLFLALGAAGLLHAGGDPLPIGARFGGMGGSGLTLVDLWSIRLNPAGIAGLETPMAGLFYQQHWLSEDLAHQGLAVALPLGKGVLGIGADRFGYNLYNETKASLTYAMPLGEGLRAAVQMDYIGVGLGENYGRAGTLVAELGVQARITDDLWIGAHLYNPNRSGFGTTGEGAVVVDERVPTVLRAGMAYTFSDKLLMTLEAEKDMDRDERFRVGVEYNPNKVLYLRTGISTKPTGSHFGVGFRLEKVDIDMAVALRSMLGPTPMINLNYRFQ
jgi:hypothetical protein